MLKAKGRNTDIIEANNIHLYFTNKEGITTDYTLSVSHDELIINKTEGRIKIEPEYGNQIRLV